MPLPVPTLDCDNGWLAPDGRLFPNPEFAYHSRVAEQICQAMGIETNDPNSHLINLGWAKLREERWYIYRNDRDGELAAAAPPAKVSPPMPKGVVHPAAE